MEKAVGVFEEDEVSQLWVSFRGYHHLLDLTLVASERIVGSEHDSLAPEQLDHKLDFKEHILELKSCYSIF